MSQTFDDLKSNFAFSDGKTVCSYRLDGKQVMIGGSTAEGIKVYDTDPDTQGYVSATLTNHTEDVTCIANSPKSGFASGGTDGLVLLYNNTNSFDKILVRSTVPIRDICYHPDGSKLAIVSDDESIRVVLIADSSKVVQLRGHRDTVKSVSYDKKGEYIVSSDVRGDIIIWSVGPKEPVPKVIKTMPGFSYKSDMESVLQTKVSWSPDNTCFAFPGTNHDIRVFQSGIWKPSYALEGEHTKEVITLAWSPNGYYLASASTDKMIVIWDTKTKKKIRADITTADVTGLAWSPTENQLVVTDVHGEFKYWDKVIPTNNSNYPHPAILKTKPVVPPNTQERELQNVKKEKHSISTSSFLNVEASDMDEDEGEELGDGVNMLFDDDLEEGGEDLGEALDDEEDIFGGDFVIDDDGAGYADDGQETTSGTRPQQQQQSRLNLGANPSAIVKAQRKLEMAFDPPTTFQPGETPYHKPETNKSFEPVLGERRYMAYNLIGAITTIFEGDHSVINVEFHDQTEYRNFHFTDHLNFSMAAISSVGTVYAVESKEPIKRPKRLNADGEEESDEEDDEEEEKDNEPSTLYFRPNNWGTDKDWTHHMLPGEDVICIAINRISVIAVTSLGYVRIFSISGVQRHIFSLENVVSVTARTDLSLLVYSSGPAFNNQQNLKYILMNTESNEFLQKDDIQLTPDSELSWIGFTETNQAAVCDTESVLRVLQRQRRPDQGCWVPVFDGKAYAKSLSKTEKYWPVGVLRDRFMCVVLRGNNPYPFFPRPPVKDIPLQLPLLQVNTEVGQLEEEIARINTCVLHERDEAEATNTEEEYQETFDEADVQMDVALLKLINLACKTEKTSKALDLTNMLHLSESVDKAVRIASFHRYTNLAEKMTSIKEAKFMGDQVPTPSTLADSLAALPSIYTSGKSTLDGDLAFVGRNSSNNNNATSSKRDQDSFMLDDDLDDPFDDTPPVKKARPFQFSSSS